MSMTYSDEFREEALRLSDEIGLRKAANQLGLYHIILFQIGVVNVILSVKQVYQL